jgi:tetraacyldisaccharide 4'-kinase
MMSQLQYYYIQVIRGKRTGWLPSLIKGLAWLVSIPYRFVVFLRNWAYDRDWLRQYDAPVPVVVSIGNLILGGTGKTPVTQLMAQFFYDDYKVAILSRGYRSPAEKLHAPVILSSGKGPLHSAAYAGDEPRLLAENLPKAWVVVGKDRVQSANLVAKQGVDVIFLDDGMQHRRMARDFEVVVLDAKDPFGQDHFFPRGLLRESPAGLNRADLVILNHVRSAQNYEQTCRRIEQYTKAPVVGIHYDAWKVVDLKGNEAESLQNRKVALFCGIAQPEQFVSTIEQMGAQIVAQKFYPDHFLYSHEELYELAGRWKEMGAEMMVCTEKDKVKLPEMHELPLPVFWIKIQPEVIEGAEALDEFIEKVRSKLRSDGIRSS